MTDHTPTPEAVCGARHLDAVNAALVCELPPGHGAHHRAQTTPGEYFNWLAAPEAAPEPVASGQPDVGVSWRSIAGRAEAALDAHRVAMAKALALATSTPWDAITDQARQVTADLDTARAGDAPWIRAYREDLEDAKKRAKEAEARAERYNQAGISATALSHAANEKLRRANEWLSGRVRELEQRAEQAEATLNRVWDLADRWEHALAADLPYARTLRAALDGEQPDAEPVPEPPCFHPSWETTGGARKCTDCGEWLDPQPVPAETAPVVHVQVNVTPQQVADAVRRILHDDRTTLRFARR